MIAISELPATANAFIDPLSQLIAKKFMLKHHGFGQAPTPPSQSVFYGGHYVQQQVRPTPPPASAYLSYGPPASYSVYSVPSYPSYVPPSSPSYGPPSSPSYGPPTFSSYEITPVVKPDLPAGCLPGSNPNPQVDYSQYAEHNGHGYGSYGNGGYGK